MLGTGEAGLPTGSRLDGGVLVFFPSYKVMEDNKRRWEETKAWTNLTRLGGKIIVEPRSGTFLSRASAVRMRQTIIGYPLPLRGGYI